MNKLKFSWFILTVSLLAIFCVTTCDSPLGMGPPIDWEPPVLTMDPMENPIYVRTGTIITGKVTDNNEVDRIVLVEMKTGGKEEVIFTKKINQKECYFSIPLTFPSSLNGEKIKAEIRAYDKMGNCGAESIHSITMIIDIVPPFTESIVIKRTDSRTAELLPLNDLRNMVLANPNGDIKKDLYKYQNGWFYISAVANDEETAIDEIYLEFYDYQHPNDRLLSIQQDPGYSTYFPRWTIKEEDIINAGDAKFGNNYKNNYYNNKAHYFYKVVIRAVDKAKNTNDYEEPGYICMFAETDKPVGKIDPGVGAIVPKATPLPVDCYDDDSLYWVFTALFTKDQWDGTGTGTAPNIASGVKIPAGTDEQKILWLKQRLTGNSGNLNTDVSVNASTILGKPSTNTYNWRYSKYGTTDENSQITEQIGTSNVDEKLIYVPTGNGANDYGNFVLVTIVADKKLAPGNGTGPEWTNKGIWTGSAVAVQVIDENEPLIVFDTDKKGTYFCPEENTFPDPLVDNKYFDIYGYTLREDMSTNNSVTKFRMAWIPYGMPDGPDKYIPEVKKALSDPALFTSNTNLKGVQYWEFTSGAAVADGMITNKTTITLPENPNPGETVTKYAKQVFKYRFSVMGDKDSGNGGSQSANYYNFTYNNNLENETKLFIIYALDNMGHEVYRQLRLLGYKEEPDLNIYDITNRLYIASNDAGLPNPSKTEYVTTGTGAPTGDGTGPVATDYYSALDAYNMYSKKPATYNNIKKAATDAPGLTESAIQTSAFQMYPRETVLKYYVKSDQTGKIPLDSITMQDITFKSNKDAPQVGSRYQSSGDLTFCEYYPDVTQRTFLFIAKDKLGNTRQIQRTVAITNAARLERITSTTQNGTYGIGTVITLRAEFSGLIYVTGTTQMYVRYMNKAGAYVYELLTCKTTTSATNPATALEFDFTVKEDYLGKLETMYEGLPESASPYTVAPDLHPLRITNGKVMDYNRNDDAFIPGYNTTNVNMPNWTNDKGSLQEKKAINLNGIRPTVTKLTFGGKDKYSDGKFYFKNGETITLTIESDKAIRASGDSTLEYFIVDNTSGGTRRGPFTAAFKYSKPGVNNQTLIYSLPVTDANFTIGTTRYDGVLADVTLYTPIDSTNANETANANYRGIVDDYGNTIIKTSGILTETDGNRGTVNVKQTLPPAPAATLTNTAANYSATLISSIAASPLYLTGETTFNIPNSGSTFGAWEDIKEYATAIGGTWSAFPYGTNPFATSGTYTLQLRYKDRAGNEGAAITKTIQIKDTFPKLLSVNTTQPNGTYKKGSNLTFNLNFADIVSTRTPMSTSDYPVTITLENRGAAQSTKTITLTAAQTNTSTISFEWNDISEAEMREGLYISYIDLRGLRDKYGIIGPGAAATPTPTPNVKGSIVGTYSPNQITIGDGTTAVKSCDNLVAGVIVDSVNPAIATTNGREPAHNASRSDNVLIKEIKLKFNEPMERGSGTIIIKPRGDYAIPAVFDNDGYYLGYTNNGSKTGTEPADGSGAYPVKFTKSDGAGSNKNRTYISGFYDIYNAIPNNANQNTLRNYLTQSPSGASMSNLTLSARTGQPVGPYKRLTHGLVEGKGYTGNYSTEIPNGNAYDALVPDTATKWVLDFKYGINQNITEVNNIRKALTYAKWRWQEIDVLSTSIVNTTTDGTVTIPLTEPLLKGLQYDVVYLEGTFTDKAGNPAPGSGYNTAKKDTTNNNVYTINESVSTIGTSGDYVPVIVNGTQYTAYIVSGNTSKTFRIHDAGTSTGGGTTAGKNLGNDISICIIPGDYFFITPGVQAPVVRVNRRSSDSRQGGTNNANFKDSTTNYSDLNSATTNWNTATITINDDDGWNKPDFNYVHYRVESETPGAAVTAQYYAGTVGTSGDNLTSNDATRTAVKGAWANGVFDANYNPGGSYTNNMAWNAGASDTPGTWVLPNLVRRSATNGNVSYNVIKKDGVSETRSFNGALRMFKSYNRDLTGGELGYPAGTATVTLREAGYSGGRSPALSTNENTKGQSYLSFSAFEAAKCYIIGTATVNNNSQSAKGIEGIYRTVIMLNNSSSRRANFIAVEGSNIKNGMPSVAGFPVRDADEADARYIKVFFKESTDNSQFYWVSTEIVCEWYFLPWGGGSGNDRNGTHASSGEASNNLMSGYGDLTYSYNQRFSYDTAPTN